MREAIEFALGHDDPEDVIDGVKSAVVKELEGLDATAEIRTTEYFNHSFAPDIVMTWKDNGQASDRNIFLRHSLASAAAGRDIPALGDVGPVLLGLREERNAEVIEEVRAEAAVAPKVLVTDSRSLDHITGRIPRSTSTIAASPGSAREPLLQLVRGNVMRGGRGLFLSDSDEVAALTGTRGETDEVAGLDSFNTVVRRLFVEDAAVSLLRAGQMIRMGISGDTTDLAPTQRLDWDRPSQVIGGRLSEAELMVVLPYLLSRDDVTDDPRYWAYVGEMISLKRLESMADRLTGLDLTRLVKPSLASWTASRASASLNISSLEGEDERAPEEGWRIHGRVLALIAGSWIIHLTSDKRRLNGRKGAPAARWENLAEPLSQFALNAVTLQGLVRRIRVEAERSDDVYRDVDTITSSLADTFQVPDVEIRVPNAPENATITADFTRMIAEARPHAPAAALLRVAQELLTTSRR
ncbi:hypothetical protein [Glycomyces sp. NPDC047010]|uniref:hypothetical protein n=1 Tax=Glycomyces sp. NPDC047010 TaxID=3155023 RepID=UPI0033FCA1E5